jgi:hypothetical protein
MAMVPPFLQALDAFADHVRAVGLQPARLLAIAAERLGRLKLNGRPLGYSPLSRFAELDFLAIGIEGKKILWANLRDLAGLSGALPDVDFDDLIARADHQRAALEPFRTAAGREALGSAAASR